MSPHYAFIALALAGAAPAGAAVPAPLPEPSAAALDLARQLVGSQPAMTMLPQLGATADGMVAMILEARLLSPTILYGRLNCDSVQASCRETAKQVAAEFAPKVAEHARRRAELTYAYFLAGSMSESEMKDASAFFASAAGRRLLEAMREAATPRTLSTRSDPIARAVRERLPDPGDAMVRRFLERSKDLPRRPLPIAPPAPPAPSSPDPPHSD